jgi:hypothetical protein
MIKAAGIFNQRCKGLLPPAPKELAMDFDRLIPTIRRLALEAGDRIMEVYNGPISR